MKTRLINFVKYSPLVYKVYYYCGTIFLKFLRFIVRPDDKVILFSSFGGRKFDDSPREIYKQMIKDERYNEFKLVWAFQEPNKFGKYKLNAIKTDGLKYYITALKARVWITNSSIERGLSFKGKKTFYFDTWHGTPLKKMGSDASLNNKSFGSIGNWLVDVFTAQGEYEAKFFSNAFNIPLDNFAIIGLPRNDQLANYSISERNKTRAKLGIDDDVKVILYAPTFREYTQSSSGIRLELPIDFTKWKDRLKDKFLIFFRAHYEVAKSMHIEESEFIHDVSNYPVLNDLMIASDILISDYSSIFFDYSIMDKPMLHFCYDFDRYEQERGMYFDIREWLPGADNEDDLLDLLVNLNHKKSIQNTISFRDKYVTAYGNASKQSLDIIAKELKI